MTTRNELAEEAKKEKKPLLTNTGYDTLKQFVQLGLPAAGTLYFALAVIWGFPYGKEVVGTIAAVNIFLGIILGIAGRRYNNSEAKFDGQLETNFTDPNTDVYKLALNIPLSEVANKKEITLRVADTSDQAPPAPTTDSQ